MQKGGLPGAEALAAKGWWQAYKYLILRRSSQLAILGLFVAGPLLDVWIVKGNIASSLTLDILPLTDPLVLLQMMLTGQAPGTVAITGAIIVVAVYLIVGGRVYCGWVCPINIVTDTAEWLRHRLGIKGTANLSRSTRYWLLGLILILPVATGSIVWELVNPVSMVYRGLVFGMGLAWAIVLGIFLLDLLIARRAWCGRLCPVGAFYGLLGHVSLLRISAVNRDNCDDCMDCFAICPEQQVIRPALKGAENGIGPVITSGQCTNCGRCIDVCTQDVFIFSHRFNHQVSDISTTNNHREVLP